MAAITVLPPALASQIAAGEVVERPASAAKELIENALDATASRCDVVCNGGGVSYLSVSDDGCGMSESDAALSIERHATSKLTQIGDLGRIATFGFRGEALPSIASVSRFTLQSRMRDCEHGVCIAVEGGQTPQIKRMGLPVGTTIIVRDLFFNVPARRKFLRSTGTESAHVTSVLEGAALSRPDVTFTLERDGRKMRELLRVKTRRERVQQLLEEEKLAEIIGERGPLRLEAHLAPPDRARAGTIGLWLLVNGRVVRDRMIAASVAQAFGSGIAVGSYPRGVVYVDLPFELVDVNVHPQKTEVRFVDPRALSDAIFALVSRAVSNAFDLPAANRAARNEPNRGSAPPALNRAPVEQSRLGARPHGATNPIKPDPWALGIAHRIHGEERDAAVAARVPPPKGEPYALAPEAANLTSSSPPAPHQAAPKPNAASVPVEPALDSDDEPAPDTMLTPSLNSPAVGALTPGRNSSQSEPAQPNRDSAKKSSRLRFLAQLQLKYLVCEAVDGLYVVDQHAAAECINYAKLTAQFRGNTVEVQPLLFPIVVELLPRELELVEARVDLFRALGLDIQIRGQDRASIHTSPRILQRAAPERLVRDLLEAIDRKDQPDPNHAVDGAIAAMACHGSLRAEEVLTAQQAQALLSAIDELDEPTPCPHGRPIVAVMLYAELERQRGRRA